MPAVPGAFDLMLVTETNGSVNTARIPPKTAATI